MNVKELKDLIKGLPDDMSVILQKDGEGNGFSPLAGVDATVIYLADSSYSGDVFYSSWSASDACMSDNDWEDFKSKNKRSVVFIPTN